jgi:hypothetical protein
MKSEEAWSVIKAEIRRHSALPKICTLGFKAQEEQA